MEEEKKVEEVKEEATPVTSGNNKGSSKVIVAIMGVVIVALVVALVIVLLNGNKKSNNDNKETNTVTNTETNTEVTNTEVEPDKPETTATELEFAQIPCGSVDFTIGTGTVTVDQISAHDKLGMLSTALLEIIGEEKLSTVVAGEPFALDIDILEIAKQYFDVDQEMEQQIKEGFGTGFYVFKQNDGQATLDLIIGGCIPPMNEGYYVKYKDSTKDNNTLIKTYYYYYAKNSDAIETGDNVLFPTSYYKLKEDAEPIYKDLVSEEAIKYESFNSFDVYFDTTNGNMKLTKVVFK